MTRSKPIHSYILNIAYFILVVYFFLYSTTLKNSPIQSKAILVMGLTLSIIAFVLKRQIDIFNKMWLYILTAIFILSECYSIIFYHHQIADFDNLLLYSMILMIVVDVNDINRLIEISFYTKLTMTVITIFLFVCHIIPQVMLSRNGLIRYSLGFFHPNTLGFIVMCLTIECLYLYIKKINGFFVFTLFCVNVLIYYITQSRTSFICVVLALAAVILVKYTSIMTKKVVKISLLTFIPIMFSLSVFLSWTYNGQNAFYNVADKLLSSRLQWGSYYLQKFGASLFGQPFPDTLYVKAQNINVLMDSAFLRVFIQSGIIIFIMICIGILISCYRLAKNNDMLEVCIIIIVLIYSFFERASNNIFLFASILVLFKRKKEDVSLTSILWKQISRSSLNKRNNL